MWSCSPSPFIKNCRIVGPVHFFVACCCAMARVPDDERWEIVELSFRGYSQWAISEATGRPLQIITRIIKVFKSERRIRDAPVLHGLGRRPTKRSLHRGDCGSEARSCYTGGERNPQSHRLNNNSKASPAWGRSQEQNRGAEPSSLLQKQSKAAVRFTQQHSTWTTEEWKIVVFTDECSFTTKWDQKAQILRPHNTQ